MLEWDNLLQKVYEILNNEETNKRELWKVAYEIKKEYGSKGLKEFSENLRKTFGISKSHNTLRQYAYVYEIATEYEIPEDLPFTVVRAIIGSKEPVKLIRRIKDETLNSYEILTIINSEKPDKVKKALCPTCKKVLNCPRCNAKKEKND